MGLTLEHACILAIFADGNVSSTAEVALALGVDHPTAARLCAELHDLGLLDEEVEQ
jgi:DNA-binding IclR family transcriptional regulator